jgi:hypothetical protein
MSRLLIKTRLGALDVYNSRGYRGTQVQVSGPRHVEEDHGVILSTKDHVPQSPTNKRIGGGSRRQGEVGGRGLLGLSSTQTLWRLGLALAVCCCLFIGVSLLAHTHTGRINTHSHSRTHSRTNTHTPTHTLAHTQTHSHTHTQSHIHRTHTHTHTHT